VPSDHVSPLSSSIISGALEHSHCFCICGFITKILRMKILSGRKVDPSSLSFNSPRTMVPGKTYPPFLLYHSSMGAESQSKHNSQGNFFFGTFPSLAVLELSCGSLSPSVSHSPLPNLTPPRPSYLGEEDFPSDWNLPFSLPSPITR